MSEYQYYEFLALDRPLNSKQMSELRALSSRATITSSRFVNHYEWGDFKGDPFTLVKEYFDIFFYYANWGTHHFMVRIPRQVLNLETARLYSAGEQFYVHEPEEFLILEFLSEEDPDEWFEEEETLSSLVQLRADIISGDLRALYLGWLSVVQDWMDWDDLDDEVGEDFEPPIPPGLGALSPSLIALADFIRLDEDLLEVAAEGSLPLVHQPSGDLNAWIGSLPSSEKDMMLLQFLQGENNHPRSEILQRFQQANVSSQLVAPPRRTIGQLIGAATERAENREREEERRREEERVRLERQKKAARDAYLDGLALQQENSWERIEQLVKSKKPSNYAIVVELLKDLREVGIRASEMSKFQMRISELRVRHEKKYSFIQRLDEANLH